MNSSNLTFTEALGLVRQPFDKNLPARQLFHSHQIKELFQALKLFLGRRGIAMVTGEIGAGKSTAIRAFTESLEPTHYDIAYIHDPTIGMRGILNAMAIQLNLEAGYFKWQLLEKLKQTIEKNAANFNKTTLLIIDEAQLLTTRVLEELRMFTNFKIDSASPLNLILLGQPELNKIIRLNSLKALFQRINCRYHLTGLEAGEICGYIAHHMRIAGRTDSLFAEEVITEIFQQAQGIPRVINKLAYDCLLEIFQQNKNQVTNDILEIVLVKWDFR